MATNDGECIETQAMVLAVMMQMGQTDLATASGLSNSTVSRWKTEQLANAVRILTALGFRLVPAHAPRHDVGYVRQLEQLVARLVASAQGGAPVDLANMPPRLAQQLAPVLATAEG